MSDKPAFPRPLSYIGDPVQFRERSVDEQEGMTLREWFAGIALQGALASTAGDDTFPAPDITAIWVVRYADALIAELRKEAANGE